MTAGELELQQLGRRVPQRPVPLRLTRPERPCGGLIVTCPHSGRYYPEELIAATRLDSFSLRRSEDAFVDLLCQNAPSFGADLLVCNFARAFVDLNRSSEELDPELIDGLDRNLKVSERSKAGLGVIPRTVGDGIAIYRRRLSLKTVQARIAEVHQPWHKAIDELVSQAIALNGLALILDCHSMPAAASLSAPCDIVIGDRFGDSCSPAFVNSAVSYLRKEGLKVVRNDPFAGGYTTQRYGRPLKKTHAMQIEINRSLYMFEGTFKLRPEFDAVGAIVNQLVKHLADLSKEMSQAA